MRISDFALNRLNLLKAIRRWGPVARTDLAKKTGLSSGLVTQLTADLVKRGMIDESRDSTKRNGRPRTFLEIHSQGALSIGSSLAGAGKLDISFVDLLGNQLHSVEGSIGVKHTLPTIANAIAEALASAIDACPRELGNVSRVGISLPALVDSAKGEVHFMTTFPLQEPVAFAAPISNRLGLPVTIENDMVCMARAEHWFGRAQDLETFTLIHVGFSIGSAQYEEGLPKSGANGLNNELGHIKANWEDNARPCLCGARGCLLTYASMFGILQAADELAGVPFPPTESLDIRFEAYWARANSGDSEAKFALHQAGKYLGVALANLINATDPGNVLIIFENPLFMSALSEPMNRALTDNIMPGVMPATQIELLVADPDWRWKGTAALALEQTYLTAT